MMKAPVAHDGYGRVAKRLLVLGLKLVAVPVLLAGLMIFRGSGAPSKQQAASREAMSLTRAAQTYRDTKGAWPPPSTWSQVLVEAELLDSAPLDPWGQPFRLTLDAADGGVVSARVVSSGPDRQPNTDDDLPRPGAFSPRR